MPDEDKITVKPTKRPSVRARVKKIPVCHRCREERAPDSITSPRSNTWAYGLVGTRFIFCSVEHRDEHDDEVRASWKETKTEE